MGVKREGKHLPSGVEPRIQCVSVIYLTGTYFFMRKAEAAFTNECSLSAPLPVATAA
ncbi:MAG TPA: hypothetical protein K8V56_00855 [Sporosarcina psychrophila]|uniref:Uncharacterized protein n=1 Tax=Sporosarcina psychrophila TaxID=1476 RepID=A0A921KBV4_SPOPS|nr:hypothetical protein [Sporosarcina psychrophila]